MESLQDLQNKTAMLEGMIDGLSHLWHTDADEGANAVTPMLSHAKQLANELNTSLDIVNRNKLILPKPKSSEPNPDQI